MSTLTLLFLINLYNISQCTRLFLQSCPSQLDQQQTITQIPSLHNHEFSCELVFFNVHKQKFIAIIKEIPNNINTIKLIVFTYDKDIQSQNIKYQNTTLVSNNTGCFKINLEIMRQEENFQLIMGFNITYMETKETEERKAYMLFSENSDQQYIVKLPNKTLIITQVCGLALMLILPLNVQYRKFLPLTFNLLNCFLYICILIIALYLQMFFGSNNFIYQFQKYFVGIFELICLIMYSQDLVMLICQRNLISFIIGFIFAITVLVCDYFVPTLMDAWFLNDIIAIMIAGAFIKFVIIRKIKTSIWAIGLLWVFCIMREFAKHFRLQKFDQGLGIRVVPLFLQLPAQFLDKNSTITCSAFGSTKIIAFGIILNYCKRVDISLSTHFYRVLISILTIICVGLQLVVNLTLLNELPTVEVGSVILFYPFAIILMLFFANKRGQWAEIWSGSFYDMAVNRASIPRSVSFEGLQSDFGRDLLISSIITVDRDKKSEWKQKQPILSI